MYFSIIGEVLLQTDIRMTTTELNFKVFLIFFGVRRRDLKILQSFIHLEIVSWSRFRWAKLSATFSVEDLCLYCISLGQKTKIYFSELIAVSDSEMSLEEVDGDSTVKILPSVEIIGFSQAFGDLLTLDEDTLCDTTVFNFGLSDVDSSIDEIVVNSALSNSIVFVSVFYNVLLEISIELQDLSVVFKPCRRDLGNIVVNRLFFGSI